MKANLDYFEVNGAKFSYTPPFLKQKNTYFCRIILQIFLDVVKDVKEWRFDVLVGHDFT
jgi:hypothetical protein